MPDTHARFSPSAANRRIHCPPSLLLEEQFEEGESIYAAEGTAGHAMAEHLIRKYLKQRTQRPVSEYYTDELLEAVDEYVTFVTGEIEDARRACKSPVLLVEQRVDASEYVDGCFGTADMVIITDKVAHIIDLKLGKGVEVHAEENPQLMIYGLGVLRMAEVLYDIETVRMTIYQPRLGNSSTWDVSPEYLKRWGEEVLRPAGGQALTGAGRFSAGSWCRFCRARNQCRARAESFLGMAKMEFRRPTLLSDEEVAEVIARADELSKWRRTCMPTHRIRPSPMANTGPATRWWKGVAPAGTPLRRRRSRPPRPPVTRISTENLCWGSTRWSGSWAKSGLTPSSASWCTSRGASSSSSPIPTGAKPLPSTQRKTIFRRFEL